MAKSTAGLHVHFLRGVLGGGGRIERDDPAVPTAPLQRFTGKQQRHDVTLQRAETPKEMKELAPPAKSNVHQHAQLRSLAEHGFDLGGHMKPLGVESIEDLTQEQAKALIIEGRTATRGTTQGQG